MTVKELKEKLNNFDDNMEIRFMPWLSVNGNWNYPKPWEEKDMSKIDVFEDCGKCAIENTELYYLD